MESGHYYLIEDCFGHRKKKKKKDAIQRNDSMCMVIVDNHR